MDFNQKPRNFKLKKYSTFFIMIINFSLLILVLFMSEQITFKFTENWDQDSSMHPKQVKYLRKTIAKILMSTAVVKMLFQFLFIMGVSWESACLIGTYLMLLLVDYLALICALFVYPVLWTLLPWISICVLTSWWYYRDLKQIETFQTNPYQLY